jgi:hypothetical protein
MVVNYWSIYFITLAPEVDVTFFFFVIYADAIETGDFKLFQPEA